MRGQPLISIVILNRNSVRSLPRLLLSLRRQTIGLSATEIVFTDTGSTDGSPQLAGEWKNRLGCKKFIFADTDTRDASPMARGMDQARGEFLFPIHACDHLDPLYLEKCLDVLAGPPFADVAYTGRIRTEGKTSRIVPPTPFDMELLKFRNIIGPAAIMRREAWEEAGQHVSKAVYATWEYWIRVCMEGFAFVNVPDHLYFEGPSRSRRTPAPKEDARAKARIVIKNQHFYHRETVRWALGLLRGEPWAKEFAPGVIPEGEDVRAMLSDFILSSMDLKRNRKDAAIDPYMRLLVA